WLVEEVDGTKCSCNLDGHSACMFWERKVSFTIHQFSLHFFMNGVIVPRRRCCFESMQLLLDVGPDFSLIYGDFLLFLKAGRRSPTHLAAQNVVRETTESESGRRHRPAPALHTTDGNLGHAFRRQH